MPLFELKSPRDMLEKARREHQRLSTQFNIDNLFNFFVTAYHIQDYIRTSEAVAVTVLNAFMEEPDIKSCRDLCDQGKHLKLTRNNRTDPKTRILHGCVNGSPMNTMPVNGGWKWVAYIDSREVDVKRLAERILEKWELFFSENGL
jgi:hypothetical protein